MEQRDLTLIFQNANFDLRVLQGCRIYPRKLVHDTMLQSYLLTNGLPLKLGKGHNNLAAIASRELGVEVDKTLQSQNWMEAELSEADMRYAMGDVQLTWEAYHRMAPKISEQGLDTVYEIERKALLPTVEMEATGLRMDRDIIDEQVKDLMEERDSSLAAFIEMLDTELPEDAKLPRRRRQHQPQQKDVRLRPIGHQGFCWLQPRQLTTATQVPQADWHRAG